MDLYGASGHAKVIIDILQECGEYVGKLFDDNPAVKQLSGHNVDVYSTSGLDNSKVIVSIGDNATRKKIVEKIDNRHYGIAVHPFASVSAKCRIEEGTVVMAGVCINSDSVIGKHCIVNTNASVDHDCRIADFVHISPGSVLCGNVNVGEGTLIGAGSVVIPGVKIGRWCTIGAGSVVISDIPDHSVAVGNPCRVIKSSVTAL